MKQKIGKMNECAWFLGIVLCSLGVCFATKSGFGMSMVVAPAYVIYLKVSETYSWFTFGMAEYCFQGILLIALCIVMKRFKWKYALTFATVIFYGASLDFWQGIFGTEVYADYWQRALSSAFSILITGIAIAFVLRTYLPQEAYEMFVKEISEKHRWNMNKVKWVYDFCSLAATIIIMFVVYHRFSIQIVGINTLLYAFLNAPLIALFGKLMDKKMEFTPAFPKLYQKFEQWMD